MDIGTISAGIGSIKAAIEMVRILRDAAASGSLKQDELAGRIAEFYNLIIETQDALIEAKDEIQDLRAKLDGLDERKQIASQLKHDGKVYWRWPASGEQTGPYCPFCWSQDGNLVPLTKIGNLGHYDCRPHGTFFVK